jgi:hypothetical protein
VAGWKVNDIAFVSEEGVEYADGSYPIFNTDPDADGEYNIVMQDQASAVHVWQRLGGEGDVMAAPVIRERDSVPDIFKGHETIVISHPDAPIPLGDARKIQNSGYVQLQEPPSVLFGKYKVSRDRFLKMLRNAV